MKRLLSPRNVTWSIVSVLWYIRSHIRDDAISVAELFRNAAEAGPLDIVKLCKGDKLLNISTNLPANTPDSPYVLQVTIQLSDAAVSGRFH